MVKNPPAMQETLAWSMGWEDPLEKRMATYYYFCLENSMDRGEIGGLQFMGSQRAGQDWAREHKGTLSWLVQKSSGRESRTAALFRFPDVIKARWQHALGYACDFFSVYLDEILSEKHRVMNLRFGVRFSHITIKTTEKCTNHKALNKY